MGRVVANVQGATNVVVYANLTTDGQISATVAQLVRAGDAGHFIVNLSGFRYGVRDCNLNINVNADTVVNPHSDKHPNCDRDANRVCDGDGNLHINIDADALFNPYSDKYPNRVRDANADGDFHGDPIDNSDDEPNGVTYAHAHADGITQSHRDCDTHSITLTHGDTDSLCAIYAHAHPCPHNDANAHRYGYADGFTQSHRDGDAQSIALTHGDTGSVCEMDAHAHSDRVIYRDTVRHPNGSIGSDQYRKCDCVTSTYDRISALTSLSCFVIRLATW